MAEVQPFVPAASVPPDGCLWHARQVSRPHIHGPLPVAYSHDARPDNPHTTLHRPTSYVPPRFRASR
jgi:hypothetical protein